MNIVIISGRLTADPEVRNTTTGKTVARFSVAVNEGKTKDGADRVQYFTINAWDKQAEVIQSYAKKGTKLLIEGRLENRSWETPEGQKRYATDILLNRFEFLGTKAESENNAESSPSASTDNSAKPKKAADKDIDLNQQLPEIDIDDMNVQMPF